MRNDISIEHLILNKSIKFYISHRLMISNIIILILLLLLIILLSRFLPMRIDVCIHVLI